MNLSIRKLKDLRKVLYDSSAQGPEEAYYVLRDPGRNITIIPPYRLGKEFPRTFGHYHAPAVPETYRILYGEGAVLMQKPGKAGVLEIKFIKAKAGDVIFCPKEFHGHMLINLGKGPLVALDDDDPENSKHLYDEINKKRGFAYYVLEEDGVIKLVPNLSYPEIGKAPSNYA